MSSSVLPFLSSRSISVFDIYDEDIHPGGPARQEADPRKEGRPQRRSRPVSPVITARSSAISRKTMEVSSALGLSSCAASGGRGTAGQLVPERVGSLPSNLFVSESRSQALVCRRPCASS